MELACVCFGVCEGIPCLELLKQWLILSLLCVHTHKEVCAHTHVNTHCSTDTQPQAVGTVPDKRHLSRAVYKFHYIAINPAQMSITSPIPPKVLFEENLLHKYTGLAPPAL